MIIYKDILTGKLLVWNEFNWLNLFKWIFKGDEMFTDSSKLKLVDGCIYEVKCEVN